ncbi:MAG: hypothetical protein ABIB98_02085 [bacterium]
MEFLLLAVLFVVFIFLLVALYVVAIPCCLWLIVRALVDKLTTFLRVRIYHI